MIGYQGYGRLARPLYCFAEADRLAGVTRGTSSRWLKGYPYWYTPEERRVLPPITPDPSPREAVSFIDLVEVVAIGKLRDEGFSLRRIRQINEYCQLALNAARPLVTQRFKTDGRDVFVVAEAGFLLDVLDKKHAREEAWTGKLWVYDLRTNTHFTLKQNPLRRHHLDEFVGVYNPRESARPEAHLERGDPGGRWRAYAYEELLKRDKVSLDLFWLRDESLEDTASLPEPNVIAEEIAEDLQAALDQFATIANDLKLDR